MARDYSIKGTGGVIDTDQYVYRKERDLSKTMVDWGQAAKDITSTIEQIRDDRAAQKADLEKQTRDRMNELAKLEQYDSETLNTKMIGASHEAGNFVQMQNDLMRRGLISPSEFLQSTQQISDNFSQLKTATKGWDQHYKNAQAKMQAGETNILSQYINEGLSGFGNLANLDLVVNPTTGTMSFVKKGADVNDPANHQSLNTINARMNQEAKFYNLSDGVQEEVDKLGEVVSIEKMNSLGVTTLEDWEKLEGSKQMMDDLVKTQMNNDDQMMSLAQVYLGTTTEDMTQDPNDPRLDPESDEYDPKAVLVEPNQDGSGALKPVFNDEQKAKMDEVVRNRFRAQMNQKLGWTKGHAPQQDTAATTGKKIIEEKGVDVFGSIVEFVTGDESSSGTAATQLASQINKELDEDQPKVERIYREGGVFYIKREGEDPFPVKSEGKSPEDVIQAIYTEATGKDAATYNTSRKNYEGTISENFGEGDSSGEVRQAEWADLDTTSEVEIGGVKQTPSAYLDKEFGGKFGTGDSYEEVGDGLAILASKMMTDQMYEEIGMPTYSWEGKNLTLKIGNQEFTFDDIYTDSK
jgi:hypothetical protein